MHRVSRKTGNSFFQFSDQRDLIRLNLSGDEMQPDEPIETGGDPPELPAQEPAPIPADEGPAPIPSGMIRETRKEAASFAKDKFDRARDRHQATYKMAMTEFQQADLGIECKQEAEGKYGVRIAMTMDVEGNWWFQ